MKGRIDGDIMALVVHIAYAIPALTLFNPDPLSL